MIKLSRKKYIIASTILLFIAVITLIFSVAFAKLATTTDGTENFTKVKLDAARLALDWDKNLYTSAMTLPLSKQYVYKIEQTTTEEMNESGLHCNVGPNEPSYYSATIQRVWLFGIVLRETKYKVCNITG